MIQKLKQIALAVGICEPYPAIGSSTPDTQHTELGQYEGLTYVRPLLDASEEREPILFHVGATSLKIMAIYQIPSRVSCDTQFPSTLIQFRCNELPTL